MPSLRRLARITITLAPALLLAACQQVRVPAPAVRYVAFGDSTTKGPSERDYPDILRERLGEEPRAFANEGHGGESTREGLDRLTDLLARSLFPNAHTLLYWEGGKDILDFLRATDPLLALSPADPGYPFTTRLNETLDRAQGNIEATLTAGRNAGLTVYVATYFLPPEAVLPCEPLLLEVILPEQAARAAACIRLLNERIRRAAANTGATLVDVEKDAANLSADPSNFHNCNHLSARGNAIVAELFRAAIQKGDKEPRALSPRGN